MPKLLIPTTMNSLIHSMPDSGFEHVFTYLINDEQFIQHYQNELVQWVAETLTIFREEFDKMGRKKK
jgi:hypothetical protein